MAVPQKEQNFVSITPGKCKLARIAETCVIRVRVPDLLYRRGSCASWIVAIVCPIEARDGFHQACLGLRRLDQALALLLESRFVEDRDGRGTNAHGDNGHDNDQKGYALHSCAFRIRRYPEPSPLSELAGIRQSVPGFGPGCLGSRRCRDSGNKCSFSISRGTSVSPPLKKRDRGGVSEARPGLSRSCKQIAQPLAVQKITTELVWGSDSYAESTWFVDRG